MQSGIKFGVAGSNMRCGKLGVQPGDCPEVGE